MSAAPAAGAQAAQILWRVVATQQGFYNQILRDKGEVFDLLTYADGGYPPMEDWVAKKGADGKDIPEEGEYVVRKDKKSGIVIHRDFAEDRGDLQIRKGPMRGEIIRSGWMKLVPADVPVGVYPLDKDGNLPSFWGRVRLPEPYVREVGTQDRRAAKILDHAPKIEAA